VDIKLPKAFHPIMTSEERYQVCYGGRGSSKSWGFATKAILMAIEKETRFLCAREFQNSIADSVHRLLVDTIYRYKLKKYFHITHNAIRCVNGSEFIFKGIKKSVEEIKSMEGIMVCWVTEAAKVSANSWDVLIPTIRKEGSQIWLDFNPDLEEDETYQRFVINERDNSTVVKMNYLDNPFLPSTLIEEADYCKKNNREKYDWVWLGQCRTFNEAAVFFGKIFVEEFETPHASLMYQNRFFYGVDWGFSKDPTVLIRMYLMDGCLYIDQEMSGVGIEIVDLPKRFKEVEGADKWKIYGDNSRPETISHLRRNKEHCYNIHGAKKYAGSVEDGVEYLRSFKRIYIHPRCKLSVNDFTLYSYKTDKNTDEILPLLLDKNNHAVDAARYALSDYIGKQVSILEVL